jgi:hypothetical protein
VNVGSLPDPAALVGQGGGRDALCFQGFAERVDDDAAGDAAVGGDRDGVAGVVVERAQDLMSLPSGGARFESLSVVYGSAR